MGNGKERSPSPSSGLDHEGKRRDARIKLRVPGQFSQGQYIERKIRFQTDTGIERTWDHGTPFP